MESSVITIEKRSVQAVLIRYVSQDASFFDLEAQTLNHRSLFQRNLFSSWSYLLLITNPSAGKLAFRNLSLQSGVLISMVVLSVEM